jgi:hybrid polyketide synthase/nonribosomal peptide synthetase ACE1
MANVQNPLGEPIAIVGSACRFPGGSSSPSKLWELLQQPRDISRLIPDSRFTTDGYHNKDPLHHGTTNVRHSYLLSEDVRLFDAGFFGIKPVEAISVDPQQRILMETVYECLESAGIALETLQGSQTGVYVGIMCGDYAELLGRDIDTLPTYYGTGTARSIISNRISYFFDWHGPSMTIDTACSSSLIAIHQAVQSLRAGDIPTAVVAGSNLLLSPGMYVAESKLKMLSPTGKSRMWDKEADGYARGDGVGAVVLKTLSRALADGDHIECVVRETGINQDGRTKGITMPSSTAQAALIRDTYARAGLDISKPSDRPQYFEAHGTGETNRCYL